MSYTLKFDIHSYWRAGTGRGGGALLDETSYRDTHQLPVLPGRTVKGLLRDAVWRMEQWQPCIIGEGTTQRWFGTRLDINGLPVNDKDNEGTPCSGQLRVSSATLETPLKDYLLQQKEDNANYFRKLSNGFYQHIHATAMEDGRAKDKSLRTMEVVIPLTLYADLHLPHSTDEDTDIANLQQCLFLIRTLGSSRNRGLGRVTVSLTPTDQEIA